MRASRHSSAGARAVSAARHNSRRRHATLWHNAIDSSSTEPVIVVRPLCILLLACFCLPAHAALRVEEAWMRQPAPGQPAAAIYFRAHNEGSAALVVNAASVKGAASAALHEHLHEDGMMHMREAPPQTVAPGATLVAEPGALHLMVFGLMEAPSPGARLLFCLRCTDGSEACGEAVVKGQGE